MSIHNNVSEHSSNQIEDEVDGGCMSVTKKLDTAVDNVIEKLMPASKMELTARMTISIDEIFYKMDHTNRGKFIIFNHENFEPETKQLQRKATDKDVESLESTMKRLKFDVRPNKDLTHKDIIKYVKEAAKDDYTHHDCICFCFLTHGSKAGMLYAKDKMYNIEDVMNCLTADNCPSLAAKPKIFIVQACRGNKVDSGIKLERDGEVFWYKIPVQADFIICYSTIEGYKSYRNEGSGSWYIQTLCEMVDEHVRNFHFADILTFVSLKVATHYESCSKQPRSNKKKQVPCYVNMLTRFLKFTVPETKPAEPNV